MYISKLVPSDTTMLTMMNSAKQRQQEVDATVLRLHLDRVDLQKSSKGSEEEECGIALHRTGRLGWVWWLTHHPWWLLSLQAARQ